MEQDLRYPIGKYEPKEFSIDQKEEWLSDIKFLPNAIESAVTNLDETQLQTPYRDGGWTVHQLVHHVADSHMHAYLRFKFGYFENNPTIKPYDENLWVTTADVKKLPVNISINSISNSSKAPPGMLPPAPLSPYALSDDNQILYLSPSDIKGNTFCHPVINWLIFAVNGWPLL